MKHSVNSLSREPVGYVIPSLGKNLTWLEKSIQSVLNQSYPTRLIVVIPANNFALKEWLSYRNIPFLIEQKAGLAASFNQGIDFFRESGLSYFGFLGDDDLLLIGSTSNLIQAFKDNNIVSAVGRCWYIDEHEQVIFHNRAYPNFVNLMKVIPNVIPHPGAIMRIQDWKKLGGFNENLKFGFDLDYWFKLAELGKIARVETPMSLFRWHPGGLTSGSRKESSKEARQIRRSHSRGIMKLLNILLEPMFFHFGEFLLKSQVGSKGQ
jgi:GT2 family glycosyltransferase